MEYRYGYVLMATGNWQRIRINQEMLDTSKSKRKEMGLKDEN